MFMRKRHLNNDSTTHIPLNHLQEGLDGTSIQTIPPKTYRWRAKMQWGGLYRERNSTGNGMNILERKRKRKKKKKLVVIRSALTFNEHFILRLARERTYLEFVSLSLKLFTLVLLSTSL